MDYNFIGNEVNQGGCNFQRDDELSRFQGRKTEISCKSVVLNATIKSNAN